MEPNDTAPQLDESVTVELKRILALQPEELSDNDKDFLRARKHYVGKNSREKFSEVFNPPKEEKKEEKKDKPQKEEKKTDSSPAVPNGEDGRNADGANDSDDDEGPDEDQV